MKPNPSPLDLGADRLVSLDVFRGLTIAGMVIVNDPGSWDYVYAPLRHAEWHGITPTDLVFPFFLYIMGVAVVLALSRRLAKGATPRALYGKILRRTLILFALGLFLNLFPDFQFAELRVAGVLQRIALVYLACALLFLHTGWRGQLWWGVGLLVGYWLAMCFIPTPGYGEVLLEPGKNLAAWVDSHLLPGRFYQGTWDPEGLLSTLPAIGTGISGMLVGHLLLSKRSNEHKLIWMLVGGFLAFVAGSVWDWFFPINKNLWTSSYVLYTSGLATLTFAACLWFVDVLGYRSWTHFGVVFGMNAIAAYVLHGVLIHAFLAGGESSVVHRFFTGLTHLGLEPKLASFLWALSYTLLIYLIAWVLYRRRIFIKI
ncbi:MAG: DUF5009 domain-containing protein [Bacteroidetes bacterium]|nr:MAG: DUF5009 domain-containing protein [Bacteroidota bacterium]